MLGVEWDIKEGKFRVKVDILPRPLTRRGILSMIHSLFDPLGFLAPITIEPKLLLRRLNDCDWDAPVNAEEAECWGKWISSLSELENVTVPSCLSSSNCDEVIYRGGVLEDVLGLEDVLEDRF